MMNTRAMIGAPALIVWALVVTCAQGDITTGLMGHWAFNGDFTDSSGNGNHGQPIGNTAVVTDPDHGQVAEFDGTGDYIEVARSETLNITGDQITLASWAWYDDVAGNPEILIAKVYQEATHASPYFSYGLHLLSNGQPRFWLRLGSTSRNVPGTVGQLSSQRWYHLAGVYNGSQMILYVDGQAVATRDYTGNITGYNTVLRLGINGGLTEPMDGKIDDVRIYNRALSAEEIAAAMVGADAKYPFARNPNPADGAVLAQTWANLTWKAGDFAVSHDVYIGDRFDDVNSGTAETFRGNQAGTSLFVGFAGSPYPDGLVPGTTYYWRIDEVNTADPNSPWKGPIWSFSIPPSTAYNPSPADGAESVNPGTTFRWTPGFGAKIHTVYFGTSFDDVNAAAGGPPQGEASYTPDKLESEKVYYWRVDEFDGSVTHKGETWAFTTPGAAGSLKPANGAVDVPHTQILNWTPATTAASHQIYFGTDREAIRNATSASPQYKGSKAKGSESYDPGPLGWHSTYYWRVDAVYAGGTVKGLPWSFRTADFVVVDDMESYNDVDPPDPASNRIFDKWVDGFAAPTTNGAIVGNNLPPYAERTIVHGGIQAMPYSYDNNLKFSEATVTLTGEARDWTRQGVGDLSLWFRGATANAPERMCIALNGTAVVYHANPNAAQSASWTRWIIPLQQFASQGVNLTNVTSVTIGFGTRGNTTLAGGTGKMYFDDIRLYRP